MSHFFNVESFERVLNGHKSRSSRNLKSLCNPTPLTNKLGTTGNVNDLNRETTHERKGKEKCSP